MKIDPKLVARVSAAKSVQDLYPLVQAAIELEHATIPPYLCGYFTLKLGTNKEVADIILSVVREEMLHMTHACNLLNALGGSPQIDNPQFVPDYPGGLPMGIGDNLEVHLRKCSIEQVREVFMAIEEPEEPIDIPVIAAFRAAEAATPAFDTIGAFYLFLRQKLEELSQDQDIFIGDPARQVVALNWFTDPEEMFCITDLESAKRAIDLIIDQGEGTSTDPFVSDDFDGGRDEAAHFYRFEEIVTGKKLVRRPGEKPPFAFAGDPVVLDTADVWNMDDNPKIAKYAPGSRSRRMAEQFSYSYTKLLTGLHDAFNGQPRELDSALGVMYELRLLAQQVLETPAEYAQGSAPAGTMTGLSFEYRELNA